VVELEDNKIILAHDSLTQFGGAERVLLSLVDLFPNSSLYTLVAKPEVSKYFKDTKIYTSFIQKFFWLLPDFRYTIPFIPLACKLLKTRDGKIILSSSSSFIKVISKPKGGVHINYCHTPTRFLWINKDYLKQEANIFQQIVLKPILNWLKKWDYAAAQKVDFFIANSKEVQNRIKQFYNRDSEVIYPGVDTNFWHKTKESGNYFLLAGRLHAHKNNELIIKVCNELNLNLHVVGTGRDEENLKKLAGPTITFLGRLNDEALRDEYSGTLAYFFPQLEDFGLMPLEAASCGTPTIALGKGGALETIIDGETGFLFNEATTEAVKQAIGRFNNNSLDSQKIVNHAREFSVDVFKQRILAFIKAHENIS
jgi:glycosyltransferase involved in cell wall biosynthesis